jgi:fatty acid desaturase
LISTGAEPHHLRFRDLASERGSELLAPPELRPPRETIVALHEISLVRALLPVAGTWALIAPAFAAALWTRHWAVWIAAALVIGRSQHALAVLMHDAAHRRMLPGRWNDWVGQWLCARPIWSDLYRYRSVHLRHHRHLLTQQDPDLSLSLPYPVSAASFRRKLGRDASGVSALVMRGYLEVDRKTGRNRPKVRSWRRLLLPTGIAAALAFFSPILGLAYVLLWAVPILTVYQVILRVRGVLEHAAVPDKDDPLRCARTIVATNPVAHFFLNPHHVAWHLEHHLYPGVPHYNLPALQRALEATGGYGGAFVVRGYREALRGVVQG